MSKNNELILEQDTNLISEEEIDIKQMIYTIRGKQVMLDNDVARLYHCETKYINRVVKRNIERFPYEFCFQLELEEFQNLRCQFVTSSSEKQNYGGRRYMPYVFTEQGIAMLSALLKSEIAVNVSINIMKAFIEMRKFISVNGVLFDEMTKIKHKMLDYDRKFEIIFKEFEIEKIPNQKIFFEGQIFDAYGLIIDIIKKAERKIVIVDNYIDDSILKMLAKKNKNVKVLLITSEKSNISELDIQKFNKEYDKVEIIKSNSFHDRFIIIDDEELYHCGASLKDLGKKCFAISKIIDNEYIKMLTKNVIVYE